MGNPRPEARTQDPPRARATARGSGGTGLRLRARAAGCLVAAAVCLAACTPVVRVRVSALNDGGPRLIGAYAITPASDVPRPGGLLFREVAAQVELAMEENGYTRVGDPGEADLVVEMGYGVSGPLVELDPAPTSTTAVRVGVGRGVPYGRGLYGPYTRWTTGVWSAPAPRGYVARERYTTRLELEARRADDPGDGPAGVPVWELTAAATTESDDLRAVMPSLVYAAGDFIGERTERAVTVKVRADEPGLTRFRAAARPR